MSTDFTDFTDSIDENHERARNRAAAETSFDAWIGGERAAAADGRTFSPRDPAVDEPIAPVARCTEADVDAAVAAAREGYETEWADRTASERSALIREWIDVMRDHLDELALLESLEVGKPLSFARADVENGLNFFEYYADVARAQGGDQVATGSDSHAYVRREPYGVTGEILPWNYPILLMGWKVGAALAAGNASVCKPAEQAPLAVVRAAQLSEGVLPDGVLNVVPGFGEEAGTALTAHADVRKLSFTGSVPVGREVMRAAADRVTPVTLELGGKNPFVVFPDADLDAAASTAAVGGFYNAGQSCDSASRILVHEDVKEAFLDRYLDEVAAYEPGDPLAEETNLGPLCYESHREKVTEYLELGREEGATVLTGGARPDGEALADGYYLEPTVFDDVTPDMRIASEEVFGPVQFLVTFESYEEAIEIANGVEYGLTAGVATSDLSLAHRAAADIQAGSVWVNQYFGTVPGTPFGGFKQSGIGRECAAEALAEYTQSKAVNVALDVPSL
ncbi:aldehyde dehydrogenase family protein [Haloprofundus salilacus]|uniref:aldehyde dehydrogenase family protein n=1 Tax=Haloprofundus salilacus TaxID=2876190 RepID=UPI001CC979EC|nr:aldehyde dehydrogenase family protein [Haloprofundus salilacus]